MPLFVVSRQEEPARPLLLVMAGDADEAVVKIEEQEEVGTLYERGYRDAADGYIARQADEAQQLQWKASVEDGLAEGELDTESRAEEWVIFLRGPEFDPGSRRPRRTRRGPRAPSSWPDAGSQCRRSDWPGSK